MKNQVIEVLNEEHGQKVKEYWKSKGINVDYWKFDVSKKDDLASRYYGIINERFDNYALKFVERHNAEIITLPEEKSKHPERGTKILIWDDNEYKAEERIFLGYINDIYNPVCVTTETAYKKYLKTKKVMYNYCFYKNYKLIPKEEIVELTIKDISEKLNIPQHLIRIKD